MTKSNPHRFGNLSPEMVLLGLLYDSAGHGYDLHRKVVADLGQVWHLSQSQAYAILKRLETRGDIFSEEIPQDKLPSRQLFHMTPKGRERFLAWLDAPDGGSTRIVRLEFVTRLYFVRRYLPGKIDQVFDRQWLEVESHIHRLEKIHNELPEGQIYDRMSLDLRLKQLNAVLEWLDHCRELLHQGERP